VGVRGWNSGFRSSCDAFGVDAPLGVEGGLQSREQAVEGVGEFLELIVGSVQGHPANPGSHDQRPWQLREAVKACARRGGRDGKPGYHDIRARRARNLGGEPNRVAACCYLLSKGKSSGRSQMSDPREDAGAPIFTVSRDGACDDAGLLRRIAQGDEDAMASFYRDHGRVVFAQVLLVVGERVLAEEIVQDAMLAVWRGAGSFRGESSVRSWVIAIARRQTRDRLRGRRLRVVDDAFLADQPGSGPGPEVTALDRAELAGVRVAIRELAPAHREVLGLAFGSGLSLPEVAGVLEIPVGTVKSRLTAARIALSRILDEKGQNR
jgi:RNA polymerase sigma-70 factor (ECF subfamily)